jgi:hypothetical protein
VYGRRGVYIMKDEEVVVFIGFLGRYVAAGDFAK